MGHCSSRALNGPHLALGWENAISTADCSSSEHGTWGDVTIGHSFLG